MSKSKSTLTELINRNKAELLKDKQSLEEIERKVEEKLISNK